MLRSLAVQNFRSYPRGQWEFEPGSTLIIGPNAVGKTNILEAIYFLASGRSFRAELNSEVVRQGKDFFRVLGEGDFGQLEVVWSIAGGMGTKILRVNGVNRRLGDFAGKLSAVLFSPADIEIVADSPATRRRYLDLVLSQADRRYRIASQVYERALRQRNRLLVRIRDEGADGRQLDYWDRLMIEHGQVISAARREFLEFQSLRPEKFFPIRTDYDDSVISPERLTKYSREEVAAGTTLVGPHRDDFRVGIREQKLKTASPARDAKQFGSRGEQRLAVFSLKMGEREYLELKTGQKPLLLLDDIFSELDENNRHRLLGVIGEQQTIMTTTDLHLVEREKIAHVSIFQLK